MTGNGTTARVFAVGAAVVLLCLASVTGAGAVTGGLDSQEPAYSVSVAAPDGLAATDDQTVAVTVTNDGDSDLLNPVVEIPLSGAINVTAAHTDEVRTVVDGSNESRRAEINASTMTGGDALYVFGRSVPEGESRTYYVTANVTRAGQVDITAEARPLYNEDLAVSATESFEVDGFGSLVASVEWSNGTVLSDAEITVDGETYTGSTGEITLREGDYNVSVDGANDLLYVGRGAVSIEPQETERFRFVAQEDLSEPGVVAGNGSSTVIPPSVGQTENTATAETAKEVETSFLVSTNGGMTAIMHQIPESVGPVDSVSVSTDTGNASAYWNQESAFVVLTAPDTADVTITYEGYRVGDADGDGTVTEADAAAIAAAVSAGNETQLPGYADVDGDGEVTAVDAMLVAQYAADNRDATYGGER